MSSVRSSHANIWPGLTDSLGRGCALAPPTQQWQCDFGAPPSRDFDNIYGKPVSGQEKCVPITMRADGCNRCSQSSSLRPNTASSTPSPPVSSTMSSFSTSSYSPPSKAGTSCPRELTDDFEFPHLIIPIDSAHPDFAHGTAFNGTMTGTISSIFNFDVPASNRGKTCTLEFLFPLQHQLETSSYEFGGPGRFHVSTLKVPATKATTFNNAGATWADLGVYSFTPGSATTIGSWPCFAPSLIGVKVSAANDTSLNYFQDFNPCRRCFRRLYVQTNIDNFAAIGLYVQVS
nr:hypothetical protein CFP56_58147 [Quercus suber]